MMTSMSEKDLNPTEESAKEVEEPRIVTNETLNKLSSGIVGIYEPEIVNVRTQINQVISKQSLLAEQLHQDNLKISWTQNGSDVQEMFSKMKTYQEKLAVIKRNMRGIYERSTKLRKRALRIQQWKEKSDKDRADQLKREEELINRSHQSS